MWLNVFGAVITLVGCFLLFDSRRLVKKYFNFGEENDATKGMKIIGFICFFIRTSPRFFYLYYTIKGENINCEFFVYSL